VAGTVVRAGSTLATLAFNGGRSAFGVNCIQCHGAGAGGQLGQFPSLIDDDWLWGGDFENIAYTVRHGIRNEEDWDARYSVMTAYDDILSNAEIDAVVNHVLAISGQTYDATLAAAGSELFLDNCAACHGDDGSGGFLNGAPALAEGWLAWDILGAPGALSKMPMPPGPSTKMP
jgi:cytochrome c oxidase cbb3-type subunit 3